MLVIHQTDCIDCGLCEPECPIDAIVPDSHPAATQWLELNRKYSEVWPNISKTKEPSPDAEYFRTVTPKYPDLFSSAPSSDL